jgi:hypothetical protein
MKLRVAGLSFSRYREMFGGDACEKGSIAPSLRLGSVGRWGVILGNRGRGKLLIVRKLERFFKLYVMREEQGSFGKCLASLLQKFTSSVG